MRKNKGYTLVELLAVIVLLGIIMAIAIPAALKLNSKVNRKGYNTKIELIEQAAESYGVSNLSLIRQGKNPINSKYNTCVFSYKNDKVTNVTIKNHENYDQNAILINTNDEKEYWCIQVTIDDLVNTENLSWDYTSQCQGKCSDEEKNYYDNIVINPASKYIINKCYIYIYYRNNRPYAYYDVNSCDKKSEEPMLGSEYRQLQK